MLNIRAVSIILCMSLMPEGMVRAIKTISAQEAVRNSLSQSRLMAKSVSSADSFICFFTSETSIPVVPLPISAEPLKM